MGLFVLMSGLSSGNGNVGVFPLCSLLLSGLVPLHNACSYGHYEVTELLLKVRITHTNITQVLF